MSEAQSEERYLLIDRLAMYLEAGWSDYLHGAASMAALLGGATPGRRLPHPDPRFDLAQPTFYCELAQWIATVGSVQQIATVCDVGAAVGRLVFELDSQLRARPDYILIEPSRVFTDWLSRLLLEEQELPEVPLVGRASEVAFFKAHTRPPSLPDAVRRISVFRGPVEQALELQPINADLCICANVLDRHPQPRQLIADLHRTVAPGGLLVVTTPFDYAVQFAADEQDWVQDVGAALSALGEYELLAENEFLYEFRYHRRCWTRFVTQAQCFRKPVA